MLPKISYDLGDSDDEPEETIYKNRGDVYKLFTENSKNIILDVKTGIKHTVELAMYNSKIRMSENNFKIAATHTWVSYDNKGYSILEVPISWKI